MSSTPSMVEVKPHLDAIEQIAHQMIPTDGCVYVVILVEELRRLADRLEADRLAATLNEDIDMYRELWERWS